MLSSCSRSFLPNLRSVVIFRRLDVHALQQSHMQYCKWLTHPEPSLSLLSPVSLSHNVQQSDLQFCKWLLHPESFPSRCPTLSGRATCNTASGSYPESSLSRCFLSSRCPTLYSRATSNNIVDILSSIFFLFLCVSLSHNLLSRYSIASRIFPLSLPLRCPMLSSTVTCNIASVSLLQAARSAENVLKISFSFFSLLNEICRAQRGRVI